MFNHHSLEPQKYWSFPASFKGDKTLAAKNMIFSNDYVGARKVDGAFYKFWKDKNGNMELLGRSKSVKGDYLNKIEWVPQLHSFFDAVPNNSCLIGEIYFPNDEGSSKVTTIMGCLKDKAIARQEKKKLHYYIFDVLAWDGKDLVNSDIETRINYLDVVFNSCQRSYQKYVDYAIYYEGAELWNNLQEILAIGGEGVVITKKGTHYNPGKRPARQTLKVKKELQETIDVVIMGANAPTRLYTGKEIETWELWENVMTGERIHDRLYIDYSNGAPIEPVTKTYFYGWAGSLIIGAKKDSKIVNIGSLSGMTEEVLNNWKSYVGKVAEITAMEVLETGGLRHPRFLNWRPDLTPNDTDWYRIFNHE